MTDLSKTVIVNDLFSEKCALKSTKTIRFDRSKRERQKKFKNRTI